MWDRLKQIVARPFQRKAYALSDDTMLSHFLSIVDVHIKLIEPVITSVNDKAILQEIKDSLHGFEERFLTGRLDWRADAWNEAYRLERLSALIEPAQNLVVELTQRLDEADDVKVPSATCLRKGFEVAALLDTTVSPPVLKQGMEAQARSLLLSFIEEIHWTLQKKYQSRFIRKRATYKITWFALGAFALFTLPYALIYFDLLFRDGKISVEKWAGLPLWTALTSGLFGAFFSRLLYIQMNWNILSFDELKDAREFSSILLRGIVGMSGAVIVYFFLQSGLLGGELVPKFKDIHLLQRAPDAENTGTVALRLVFPNPELALLVIWSFLAGFSERLVPSILQSTEATLGQAATHRK